MYVLEMETHPFWIATLIYFLMYPTAGLTIQNAECPLNINKDGKFVTQYIF
jgi:hypothetical protein